MTTRGHRRVQHATGLALEAWAAVRTECFAEAVQALVGGFVDVPATRAVGSAACTAPATDDEDLLLKLLEEVIYQVDVYGRVPLDTEVEDADEGGLLMRFAYAEATDVTITGAVPKGVTLHALRFGRTAGIWRCHATVDV